MNLYIQIKNGQPINHPVFEDNLIEVFGCVPEDWEKFVRAEHPQLEEHEIFDDPHVIYEKINGVWTDIFQIKEISEEEKQLKEKEKRLKEINEYKARWNLLPQRDNFSAWVFNEEIMQYEPPIPRPTDRPVVWHGASNSWVDRPDEPNDGKEYHFDFYTSSWVEVTE
jgi:hypothetical protein